MAYQIHYEGQKRIRMFTYTEENRQCRLYPRGPIEDRIIIKPEGRNLYAANYGKKFNEKVIYRLCDYSLLHKYRKKYLQIIVLFDESDTPFDIVTIPNLPKSYPTNRPVSELLAAIIESDQFYGGAGGVSYARKMHQYPKIVDILKTSLETICTPY